MSRARIVREARRWIGTPYQHQASCRGAGCDCLGLVRGIWRTLYGDEPETIPPYTPHWDTSESDDRLFEAAARHLVEQSKDRARPGHVLLFSPQPGGPARHCAILSTPRQIIHAYWGRAVSETTLAPWWRRRVVAAFAFPDRSD